jgi:hypothetical protein
MTIHSDIWNAVPPAPCDFCPFARRCARESLACEAFRAYAELRHWRGAPREPSAAIFRAVYEPRRRWDEETLARLREARRASTIRAGHRNGRRPQRAQEAIVC